MSLLLAQLVGVAPARAEVAPPDVLPAPLLRLQLSNYTHHFHRGTEYQQVVMLGLEREHADAALDGVVLFKNSFGQTSVYAYPWGGVLHRVAGVESLSFKWTAGLLYGYVDSFEKKVPLNYRGFAPAVIVGLSYELRPGWSVQFNVLGAAGVMVQFNVPLN